MDAQTAEHDKNAHVVKWLRDQGYKVLPQFVPGLAREYDAYHHDDEIRNGMVIDTETTSADPGTARIMQLAFVPFLYSANRNVILSVGSGVSLLEDPGIPATPEAEAVHGITAERVYGCTLHPDIIADSFKYVDLIIAHNASFDRPIIQKRLGGLGLSTVRWMCSYKDIDWKARGCDSGKLSALLESSAGEWFGAGDAHDALNDCYALVHVLARTKGGSPTPFTEMREAMQRTMERVFAFGAPFETKDVLKKRGYAWNDGMASDRVSLNKCWWRDITAEQLDDEKRWLAEHVYFQPIARTPAKFKMVDPYTRFLMV